MLVGHEEIQQVVQSVWENVLGSSIDVVSHVEQADCDPDLRTGFLQITGTWEGVVVCKTTTTLARSAECPFARNQSPSSHFG